MEDDGHATRSDLPGSFAPGEPSTDDGYTIHDFFTKTQRPKGAKANSSDW
jgi:hypothetical protein